MTQHAVCGWGPSLGMQTFRADCLVRLAIRLPPKRGQSICVSYAKSQFHAAILLRASRIPATTCMRQGVNFGAAPARAYDRGMWGRVLNEMEKVMSGRSEKGMFLPGNRFWTVRSSHGANPKFAGPDELWKACCEYFEWNASNPLYEVKAFAYEGVVTQEPIPKMRAMTIGALCIFLDIDETTWRRDWPKTRPDLFPILTRAEAIIYAQKFEGASADLLNASIIARDLGLADKRELSGPNGGAIRTINSEMTPQEAAEAYAATIDANKG